MSQSLLFIVAVLSPQFQSIMDLDSYVLPPPATPPRRPPKRSNQLVGVHFESPKRRRPWRKDSELVVRPGLARQEQELTAKLNHMLGKLKTSGQTSSSTDSSDDLAVPETSCQPPLANPSTNPIATSDTQDYDLEHEPHPRRILPDEVAQKLYSNWLQLIPSLLAEYLGYLEWAQGRQGRFRDDEQLELCTSGLCTTKETYVQCLHFDCLSSSSNVNYNG